MISTNYTLNPAGQITNISGGQNNSIGAPTILNVSQEGPYGPVTWSLGNGLWGQRSYDSMGRTNLAGTCTIETTQPWCSGGGIIFFSNSSIVGQRLGFNCDSAVGICINPGYDEFNRITSTSSYGTPEYSYTYDRYGNRWTQTALQGGPSPSYLFNTANNQISNFSYDAAGNLTNDAIHTYSYDAEGNILTVDGGTTASYTYSALNRRVEARTNSGATIRDFFFNANGQRSEIWDGVSQTLLQAQTYWGGTPVAYFSNGSIHFQHQDWMGTERARTSYNGGVEGIFTSQLFGDAYGVVSGTDTDAYHYAQLDHDSESSTEHAQFRQYNSTQGRWMSPDPYDGSYDPGNPQTLNRYSYALNNPFAFVDPSGLNPCDGGDSPLAVHGHDEGEGAEGCDPGGSPGGGEGADPPTRTCIANCGVTPPPPDPSQPPPSPPPVGFCDQPGNICPGTGPTGPNTGRRCIANCGKPAPPNDPVPSNGWSWDEKPHWPTTPPGTQTQPFGTCFKNGWSQSQTLPVKVQVGANLISLGGLVYPNPVSTVVGTLNTLYTFGTRVLPTALVCITPGADIEP